MRVCIRTDNIYLIQAVFIVEHVNKQIQYYGLQYDLITKNLLRGRTENHLGSATEVYLYIYLSCLHVQLCMYPPYLRRNDWTK